LCATAQSPSFRGRLRDRLPPGSGTSRLTTAPERHPWNTAFEWRACTGPFRILDNRRAAHFDSHGYLLLPGAFALDEIAVIRDEIDRFEMRTEELLATQPNGRLFIAEVGALTFSLHLASQSALLRKFAAHPIFAGLCADLVGPDVDLYWDQAVYKKPEKPRRFPWHQDNGYTFVEPQQYLTCWVALTDATIENGCPQVVPGLHRKGTLKHRFVDPLGYECLRDPPDAVAAPIGAGGIVVFSSLTPHLTGPNTTDDVRKAYILQYASPAALVFEGDPSAGLPTGMHRCDESNHSFAILRGGSPQTPRAPAS
jgi:phytanoyl-CoA hydroxylase